MREHLDFYASLGLQTIPLWGIVNGVCRCRAAAECANAGKHPKARWRGEPSRDPGPLDNVGVATDPLVVLDFDTVAAFDEAAPMLPDTFVVRTAKGVHVWYAADPQRPIRSTVGWRPSVDVRAVGGLVVAPPSRTVQQGTVYEALRGLCAPSVCPDWLLAELPAWTPPQRRVYHGAVRPVGETSRHFRPLVDRLLAQLAEAVSGTRNRTLYIVAARLHELHLGGYVGESARSEVIQTALEIGLDAEEVERTVSSAWR